MTINEAKKIIDDFNSQNGEYSEEDFFLYTEAAQYLIKKTNNTRYMGELGGYYYERKEYDLALKYYEMASDLGDIGATIGLGYIWYYGRTGEVNYEKAFKYFSKVKYISTAQIKLADMYKNGYYVEKDYDKYCEIIENLYTKCSPLSYYDDPTPEVYSRLAGIREKQGNIDEAVRLLKAGIHSLISRIECNSFFGNFSIMKGMIEHLYRLIPLNRNDFGLYDLYEVMKDPVNVRFTYAGKQYIIESSREPDGTIAVKFEGKWYHSVNDMLMNAHIGDERITDYEWRHVDFEIME
ncbi:MAG: sel1 repeat family protein [Ruminococcus sp.]|nr:sel1 repeat family protein [Ruminococcus sp.]